MIHEFLKIFFRNDRKKAMSYSISNEHRFYLEEKQHVYTHFSIYNTTTMCLCQCSLARLQRRVTTMAVGWWLSVISDIQNISHTERQNKAYSQRDLCEVIALRSYDWYTHQYVTYLCSKWYPFFHFNIHGCRVLSLLCHVNA